VFECEREGLRQAHVKKKMPQSIRTFANVHIVCNFPWDFGMVLFE